MKASDQLVVIEWDSIQGVEKYLLPINNALALVPFIMRNTEAITIYDYDKYQTYRDFTEGIESRGAAE